MTKNVGYSEDDLLIDLEDACDALKENKLAESYAIILTSFCKAMENNIMFNEQHENLLNQTKKIYIGSWPNMFDITG